MQVQPPISHKNMLSPVGYKFSILRLPEVNFFCQRVTLPGITLPVVEQPTPFKDIPWAGDHIPLDTMSVSFKVNEDLGNYIEIVNWLKGLGFPESHTQYANLVRDENNPSLGLKSDGALTILSSAYQPIVRVKIKDMFPISITPLEFNAQDTEITYLDATAEFSFLDYEFVTGL